MKNNKLVMSFFTGLFLSCSAVAWYLPYGPGLLPPPAFNPMMMQPWSMPVGPVSIRTQQDMTDEGYRLSVYVNGIKPNELQIKTEAHALVISVETAEQRQEQNDDQRYYFSRSSTMNYSKRIFVPMDGDLQSMRRTDEENRVELIIPRKLYSDRP